MVIAPNVKAQALSNIILLIPAKRQNGSAIKNLFNSIEYGIAEKAIKSTG
jgi:hypothetical protein